MTKEFVALLPAAACARFGEKPGSCRVKVSIAVEDFTFSLTGKVSSGTRNIAGGCVHREIGEAFPELRHLVKWHLMRTDIWPKSFRHDMELAGILTTKP